MQMWIQLTDQDEDEEFSDDAAYQVHANGVLEVTSGSDIRLYSPTYWQVITIDTRPAEQREKSTQEVDDELKWQ